ncbi:hypothetical protein TEA_003216 [Camellia sinensis var. sinensis]|uniref:F-box domain-containing protein n=1 Tax=Camellia sinensis var. sinensis TaxID=542762 RepID=A0A4S4DUT1_CAMSN|nr:hypothetical protein TEA_003216 [Camellia sinensis var. sinensis]
MVNSGLELQSMELLLMVLLATITMKLDIPLICSIAFTCKTFNAMLSKSRSRYTVEQINKNEKFIKVEDCEDKEEDDWLSQEILASVDTLKLGEDSTIKELSERYEPELAAVSTGSHIDAIPYLGKYFYWHCDCNCCSCKYQTDLEGHAGAVLMPNRYSGAASWRYRQHPKQVTPGNRIKIVVLNPQALFDESIVKTMEAQHCNIANLHMQVMITRAYHDSSTLRTCGEQIEDLVPVMVRNRGTLGIYFLLKRSLKRNP